MYLVCGSREKIVKYLLLRKFKIRQVGGIEFNVSWTRLKRTYNFPMSFPFSHL